MQLRDELPGASRRRFFGGDNPGISGGSSACLEYALGSEDTPYGSLRAQYGRKEPFRLKYVEIGNENFGPEYNERYELFYHALKAAFPQVIYISNGHTEREKLPTDFADEHYYDAPEFFLEM